MKLLEERILRDGKVKEGNILKVDSFLNHQIDTELYAAMGEEFKRLFEGDAPTKILTTEASGIGIACFAAHSLGIPALFAKKVRTTNIDTGVFRSSALSYTTGKPYEIVVSKQFLHTGERILIIDDFLARGEAAFALLDLIKQAGAVAVGCGFAVEKGFQDGGKRLRATGLHIESLAIVESMSPPNIVKFRD